MKACKICGENAIESIRCGGRVVSLCVGHYIDYCKYGPGGMPEEFFK